MLLIRQVRIHINSLNTKILADEKNKNLKAISLLGLLNCLSGADHTWNTLREMYVYFYSREINYCTQPKDKNIKVSLNYQLV